MHYHGSGNAMGGWQPNGDVVALVGHRGNIAHIAQCGENRREAMKKAREDSRGLHFTFESPEGYFVLTN